MSHEGLKYNTKERMIQTSHSIAYTAGNVQPVLCLMAGGKAFQDSGDVWSVFHVLVFLNFFLSAEND